MKLFNYFSLCIIFIITFSADGFSAPNNNYAAADSVYAGLWQGILLAGQTRLTIVFHINQNGDSFTASMDSPDQGVNGIPVSSAWTSGDSIKLDVASLNGFYEAKLNRDSLKLDGTWNQNGLVFPLVLHKTNKLEEVKRPQEPGKPYPYKEEEINFKNDEAGITLAGTLTLPESGSDFPAVILITGSGPQDRNETLMNHKPFLILADYLTRKGIAVLRYDDRGFGKSGGDFSKATTLDFVSDALAAADYLRTRKEINKNEIGMIGHSEGGEVAPLAAVKSDKVDFIVLMAGPGLPGADILRMQTKLILKSNGVPEDVIHKSLDLNEKAYSVIKTENDTLQMREKLDSLFKSYVESLPKEDRDKLGPNPQNVFKAQIKTLTSPWFKFFLTYDPRPTLEKVKVPVLAINGEKDIQVPAKENLDAISKALKEGGNKDYKVEELKGLNHLFQTAKTGAISEYAQIQETMSPKALETISNWILKTVNEKKK